MLSAVPLSLAADGSPLIRHGQDFASAKVNCREAKAGDAVLRVTVEVSGATYLTSILSARRSARDSGASSAVGDGHLPARACVGHRATSLVPRLRVLLPITVFGRTSVRCDRLCEHSKRRPCICQGRPRGSDREGL